MSLNCNYSPSAPPKLVCPSSLKRLWNMQSFTLKLAPPGMYFHSTTHPIANELFNMTSQKMATLLVCLVFLSIESCGGPRVIDIQNSTTDRIILTGTIRSESEIVIQKPSSTVEDASLVTLKLDQVS